MPLSPQLQSIFDDIMKAHPDGLTLNELSEELLMKKLTYTDIEEIIGALEDAGVDLEAAESPAHPADLARVLAAARALTEETGRRPSPSEIAERVGLTPAVVRRALQLGRSIARPT
ncbi:MAG TPA: sigma-70 domain-containing protein [Polyangia bacterium]|nr:sigma-70 domain-containing protein [Polyangia bacterium]